MLHQFGRLKHVKSMRDSQHDAIQRELAGYMDGLKPNEAIEV